MSWFRTVVAFSALMLATTAHSGPAEVAEIFVRYLIDGETRKATELVAEPDRFFERPLGGFDVLSKSRFPSRWTIEVVSVEEGSGRATVDLSLRHPEIEDSLRRTTSAALEELALRKFLDGDLEMTTTDARLILLPFRDDWRVVTFAERNAWLLETRYPPKADIAARNRSEIEDFRDRLLDRFPSRVDEIAELVGADLARLDAADALRFEDVVFVDDRTRDSRRYNEPAYEVSFQIENGSKLTITRIYVSLVFRDAEGVIVDTSTWLLTDDDLPSGLGPGEKYRTTFGRLVSNPGESAASAEVVLADVEVR